MNGLEAYVHAIYSPQKISRYQGNSLIEALPPSLTELQLFDALKKLPDFAPEQRNWDTHERLSQIAALANFCIPLERHVRLGMVLDSLIREGYVGRPPRTAQSVRIFQQIYENQKRGVAFPEKSDVKPALSSSLVGLSGMGKTTILRRLQSLYPPVIYHNELDLWQIPYLHVETPHDGASAHGFAYSAFRKIDQLIPDVQYFEKFGKQRHGLETLLNSLARALHAHNVGILVLDEIQNLENSPKSKASLMTMLVSASNELGVPLMFVGTNKARRVLSLDFRQARRAIGHGLEYWDRLKVDDPGAPNDWKVFLEALWQYQWTRNPVELNPSLASLMYHHTQGVLDLVIKLFAMSQIRAILDGTETISSQTIDDVARYEMALVRPMVEALRDSDLEALENYDDIAPLNFENILRGATIKLAGSTLRTKHVGPGNPGFVPAVSDALRAVGLAEELADTLASQVETDDQVSNVLEGTAKAIDALKPKKSGRKKTGKGKVDSIALPADPHDLRGAMLRASAEGTTVAEQLRKMGAAVDIRTLVTL